MLIYDGLHYDALGVRLLPLSVNSFDTIRPVGHKIEKFL